MPVRAPKPYEPPSHVRRAWALRRNTTPEERKLWAFLRGLKPQGFHFRRQAPMGPFIADFACHRGKIVIEADGSQHEAETDAGRDASFRRAGDRTLRFSNDAIRREFDGVVRAIEAELGLQGY